MKIDDKVAYRAMEIFLEEYWKRVGRPDDLAILLSGIHLCDDGQTSDPAHWGDWVNALNEALQEQANGKGV
ncbi:hypothetical protein [Stigmatella hybrida]|uniref:hypothetical protein n=1 Tax=Stigmatella hybrida TaxID=394097 RepID=UPI001CDB24A5|nr:hypothetical protein [Stigmatella hybrida]